MNKNEVLQSVVAIIVLAALALSATIVPAQSESVVEASTSEDVGSSAQQMLLEQIERTQALRAAAVEDNASGVVATAEEVALDAHVEQALAFMEADAISASADTTIIDEEMERAIARGSSIAEVLASSEPVLSVQQLINDKIELVLAESAPGAHATTKPALDAHIERALAFRKAAGEDSATNVAAIAEEVALDAHIGRALAFIEARASSSASGATESPEQQMLREQIARVRTLEELEG